MKKNKAVNVTKGGTKSDLVTERNRFCSYNSGNGRAYIRHATIKTNHKNFKNLDLQNVSNWSHLTCSCENSGGKYKETGYFTTKLNQMQSKSFTEVGVGSVKVLQKRKVKRIYLPATEERAVGTLDFPLCENPKCQHYNRFNELCHRTDKKLEERAINSSNKKYFVDKKLSPFIRTKSNCTNPLSTHFNIHELNKSVDNTPLNKLVNVPTQVGPTVLGKSPKIKIFKELAMNTESNPNDKVDNSEIEISLEMSRLLNNKNQVEFSSSLDSLVQHVYNLDKPYNGTASQISIDPMENKLEREYRKIFTSQSRECPCNNKFSTTNSDSLLRRFEALRRDTLGEKESKRNSISKNSSHINKPICKDVCIDSSEQPAPYAASNSNMKTISPLPSIHKKSLLKTDKNNDLNPSKPKKSTHWRSSDVEGNEHQGLKGMFKSWGKKLSLDEGCYKKSKLKCFDSKKKSTSSVKSGKLFNIKSTDEKDERKFRFFRKKVKVGLKVSKSKKDVMTGRCEVREGLTIKIGKSFLKQDQHVIALKKTPSKYEINDDMVLKTWLQRFVSKSDESTKNLTMRWDSSVYGSCSDGSEIQTKSSYETDILLYSNSTQKNDSRHKTDRNCLINFSRQYIQAWMIPKTILDRIVKTKIYWNAKSCNKYNRKKEIDFGVVKSNKYSIDKSVASPDDVTDHNSPSMREDYSSECVMVNISLGRISELRQQTYTHKTSNEEVYNVIDYETPLPSSENFLGDEKDNIVVNNKSTKESINRKDNDFKGDQLNSEKVPSVLGIRIIPQRKMRDLKYPLYDVKNYKSDDNLEGSLYLLRKNYKNAEIYLRNLCNKWIPLGLDLHLWCISDPKLQSSCSVNKKDENFHSYPNIADNIRFTTLASSRDAAINKGSEKCASRNKRSSIKTIIRKNKNEKTEIGVRIWPKDSLEVLKKRRLYSNSNKGKWHYDKELSVTVSNTAKSKIQSKSKMNKLPKKHVTISETETNKETKNKVSSVKVMGIDKCLKNNMKLPGLPTSQHASEFLKETSIVPETNPKKNGGKIISQNVSLESDDTTSSDDDENCYSSEEYSNSVFPRKEYIPNTPEYPNLKPNNDNNCSKSSNQNKTTTEKVKDVSSKSGFNFSDCLKPSAIRNKCQNLRQKFTFEKKNSIESIKNENKIKKCSITTDVQKISSLSKMFPDDKHDPEINRVKAKMLGLHFKKQPIKRNISRACWTVDDKHETNVAGDLINDLKKLASTNDFKECPKIETEDVNGDLVEVKNERKNTNTSVCLDRKESQLCTISVLSSKKKSYHDKDAKIDKHNDLNKGSDFIEISFKIKRKQIDDKALFVNINESSDRDKKEDLKKKIKKKESNATNKNNAVYLLQNESESSIVYENSKSFINVKILIKSCKEKNDFINQKSQDDKLSIYSKIISDKLHTISSGLKKSINANLQPNANLTIDFINSVEKLTSNNGPVEDFPVFTSDSKILKNCGKNVMDIQKAERDADCKEIINPYNLGEKMQSAQTSSTKSNMNEDKLLLSSINFKPSTNPSVYSKTLTNCIELHKKVIQKIIKCAKDLNKSKRKEKAKKARRVLRAMLLSEWNNKYAFEQDTSRYHKQLIFEQLRSKLQEKTLSSHSYCQYKSEPCIKDHTNLDNYYYNVVTKTDKRKASLRSFVLYERKINKRRAKKLATKLGRTDLRTHECASTKIQNSNSSSVDEIDTNSKLQHFDEKDFIGYLSSDILYHTNHRKNSDINSFLKPYYADEIIIQANKRRSIKNTIEKKVQSGAICVHNEAITIVKSNFVKENRINLHQSQIGTTRINTKEKPDLLQLPEIKRAVFEMYNATEVVSNNSEFLNALPKFVNDVENLLII